MNYQPKNRDLTYIVDFFCNKYGYKAKQRINIQGMGCASTILENPELPNLKIDMERYYLDIQVENRGEYLSLISIQKFLHPKQIIRDSESYRKKRNFKKYYISDNDLYLNNFLRSKDIFDNNQLHSFFKQYPFFVWKWK